METERNAAWRPLLGGRLAERAAAVIDDIAGELAATRRAIGTGADAYPARVLGRPHLGTGSSGPALFFAYLDPARPGGGALDEAVGYLELAVDQLGRQPAHPILYDGFFGVGWVAEHLKGRAYEPGGEGDDGDPNVELDELLLAVLAPGWAGDYDLIRGLVGLGVYALERLPAPPARRALDQVVSQLAERAEERPDGLAWWTPAELALTVGLRPGRSGHYNLGVAHGAAGTIGFLAHLVELELEGERARPLLEGAVAWFLAQGTGDPAESIFPDAILPGEPPQPTRTAWCYGDAGIAAVLLRAARAAGRPEWEARACAVARAVARRPLERMAVIDAGLCHGAAGLGHLFNRLWQATGDDGFRAAAVAWFERALAMRRPGDGFAGFRTWTRTQDEVIWREDPSFLTGAAGIGLALLAATTPVAPEWDRVMLLSMPPRRAR